MIRILNVCDPHGGSAAGLTPPDWQYPQRPPSGLEEAAAALHRLFAKVQRVLWQGYTQYLDEFGPVDIVVAPGDLTDGSRFETIQHITTDSEEQAGITCEALERIRFRGHAEWYFAYGTPAHTVNGWNYEHRVADHFDAPISDTIKLEPNGLKIQWRHHGGRSDIPYGQGTQLSKEVVRDILRASIYKYPAADVVVRGHTHYWYHLGFAEHEAFSLPSLEVPLSVYGRKLRTLYYDIGLVLFEIDRHGNLDPKHRLIPLRLVLDEDYRPILDRRK